MHLNMTYLNMGTQELCTEHNLSFRNKLHTCLSPNTSPLATEYSKEYAI